jgi:hypothetical protein
MNFMSQVTLFLKIFKDDYLMTKIKWFWKVPYVCETFIQLFLGLIMQLPTI